MEILNQDIPSYIRLTGVEIVNKLLHDEHERVHELALLSMDKFGMG
ncbi:MAG: hypothetical protein GXP45_06070 [bacterium]|nr:hypothetical protein [bacterium]